jgi:hypothetical protein
MNWSVWHPGQHPELMPQPASAVLVDIEFLDAFLGKSDLALQFV